MEYKSEACPLEPSTMSSRDLPAHCAFSGRASSSFSLVTYAWWCLPWWYSRVSALMWGARAPFSWAGPPGRDGRGTTNCQAAKPLRGQRRRAGGERGKKRKDVPCNPGYRAGEATPPGWWWRTSRSGQMLRTPPVCMRGRNGHPPPAHPRVGCKASTTHWGIHLTTKPLHCGMQDDALGNGEDVGAGRRHSAHRGRGPLCLR